MEDLRLPRILIADDEAVLRELMRVCLGPHYRYSEAADGEHALALLRGRRFDLLVLDLMLPGVTGLEVLTQLRNDAAIARTPVLVATAQPGLLDDARRLGADAAIGKPFDPEDLAATAADVMRRGRRRAA